MKFIVHIMENRHKETNLLCMNFTEVEHVFVGSIWKSYKNFPIDGANTSSGVKKMTASFWLLIIF